MIDEKAPLSILEGNEKNEREIYRDATRWVYPDRAAGSNSHHRDTGRHASAGTGESEN
jgi:hypothetical protein